MTPAERTLGVWSGILSAVFAVVWFVTYSARDVLAPMPNWRDTAAYAAAYSPLRTLYVYPANGGTPGVEMFLPDNTSGVFAALANSYVYMALAMVAAGFAFEGGRLQRIIRMVLLAQAITAVGQAGWSFFGLPTSPFIASSLVWVVGAPIAFTLIALLFRRGLGMTSRASQSADPRPRLGEAV